MMQKKKSVSVLCLLLVLVFVLAMFPVHVSAEEADGPVIVDDGRDRPSNSGRLRVIDGKLCSESGEKVMLRGVSTHGVAMTESFINQKLFHELAGDMGVNVVRLALYTTGTGITGYCTGGDKARLDDDIIRGVECAKNADMYVIIDWHILSDGNPNTHKDEAVVFFEQMSERFGSYKNVLFEICNEPNGCSWNDIREYAGEVIPVIRANAPEAVIIVGTPNWSQELDKAAADPLGFDNLMYTLHFYSATHKEELREVARMASGAGLPIFVTEYGVTASSGGFPRDLEEADRWVDFLEGENISYCLWSMSKVPEACSVIRRNSLKYSGFTEEDYTDTGLWLIENLKNHK